MKAYYLIQNNHKTKTGDVKLNILISLAFLNFQIIFFMISSTARLSAQDTLICDNGGFEDDFLYYFGAAGSFLKGSNSCIPVVSGVPTVFTSTSLPSSRRFEIVSSGTDNLVGINQTKFGSKAARINYKYGHDGSMSCNGSQDVNKLTKRFKVTEENREFTVWYAAVLEYPTNPVHNDDQPFFSIKCDLAPSYDLCFDSDLLNCPESYSDSNCTFVPIKVLDWACHRVKIPQDQIDQIATLEIMASDCGIGDHIGYAYIDGICEECTGSALGSGNLYDHPLDETGLGIDHYTCDGDSIKICGDYTIPSICGEWRLDSIKVPNFTIYEVSIDTTYHTFCFILSNDSFLIDTCRPLFVELYFSDGTIKLPTVLTNTIEICTDDFQGIVISATRGNCYDNGTSDLLSDDYYYVYLEIDNTYGKSWTIKRALDDPYDGESGVYTLGSGSVDSILVLGPFLIQEGSWEIRVDIANCDFTDGIEPPDFCGACSYLNKTEINEITCKDETSSTPTDDTWKFTLYVDRLGYSGDYALYKNTSYVNDFSYNNPHTISAGSISGGCIKIKLETKDLDPNCISEFLICPPKSCSSGSECNLEAYVRYYQCEDEEFSFGLEIVNPGSGSLCYRSNSVAAPMDSTNLNNRTGSLPSGSIGTFTEDIYLTVYLCSNQACLKKIYVPYLNCDGDNYGEGSSSRSKQSMNAPDILIIPNPTRNGVFRIYSRFEYTTMDILGVDGKLLYSTSFNGKSISLNLEIPSGIYFLKYSDGITENRLIKFINH